MGLCWVVALLCQGCVLDRLWRVQSQLCEESIHVDRGDRRSTQVRFLEPTLLDGDVTWLMGREPTEVITVGSTRVMRYVVVRSLPVPEATPAIAEFHLRRNDGAYRLAEIRLPSEFDHVMSDDMIEEAMASACDAETSLFARRASVDLSEVDTAVLPGRLEIRELLGPPDSDEAGASRAEYSYCIVPCSSEASEEARISLEFDGPGRLRGLRARYLRYGASVDLVSEPPIATVEIGL